MNEDKIYDSDCFKLPSIDIQSRHEMLNRTKNQ
jgi:hypothetical protein